MMPRMWGFGGSIIDFAATGTCRCLKINAVFRGATSTFILQVWYLLIGIHFIVFHVEFDDGSSISFEKQAASSQKICNGRSRSF
jgi:hypothetical protein